MSVDADALACGPRTGMSSAPLLTRTALVPAARASLPPRPRASSTLWICRAAHTADVTALCVKYVVSLATSQALVHLAHMHRAGEGAQNLL